MFDYSNYPDIFDPIQCQRINKYTNMSHVLLWQWKQHISVGKGISFISFFSKTVTYSASVVKNRSFYSEFDVYAEYATVFEKERGQRHAPIKTYFLFSSPHEYMEHIRTFLNPLSLNSVGSLRISGVIVRNNWKNRLIRLFRLRDK